MSVRVLIVDDTILFRKLLADALREVPNVEIVGTASNGRFALHKIQTLSPDLLLLDLEMPEMNGMTLLEEIRKRGLPVGVIVITGLTRECGDLAVQALSLGAFDVVAKQEEGGGPESNRIALRASLLPLIQAFAFRMEILTALKGGRPEPLPSAAPPAADRRVDRARVVRGLGRSLAGQRSELVVVGVSTGGPNALAQMLPALPGDLRVPVLVVQHMPPLFTHSLAQSLSGKCALRVKEADDGEDALAGNVYIAPGGRQMRLRKDPEGRKVLCVTDDPPENNCRPSVDYLFRSVAHQLPGQATAVIMTGMGNDGVTGLKLLKRHGCLAIAQDERSCVVFGMPREAIKAGVIDIVAPLECIAQEIVKAVT